MLSYINAYWLTPNKVYADMVALSTDSIDIPNVANGSKLYLMDTMKSYRFDESGHVFRQIGGSETYDGNYGYVFKDYHFTIASPTPLISDTWDFELGAQYQGTVSIDGVDEPLTFIATCIYDEFDGYYVSSNHIGLWAPHGNKTYLSAPSVTSKWQGKEAILTVKRIL